MRRALCLALLLGACARAPESRPPFLDEDRCGSSGVGGPVSALVLDSASLGARLDSLLDGVQTSDTVSLRVVHSPADKPAVRVHRSHGLPGDRARELELSVLRELLPPENPHGNPPYRLLFAPASASLSLGRVRMCPPRLLNSEDVHDAMRRVAPAVRADGQAMAVVTIDSLGSVTDVALLRASGDVNIDAVAIAAAAIARFVPGTYDGEPVQIRMALPVTFAMDRRRR